MERQIAILSQTGDLPLPAEAQTTLGLHPGSRLAVSVEDGRIVLQPVSMDDLDELCGIFSTNPGSSEELQQERRKDRW
ncbi:AbrB/MazE/SpoVT family DNA-binding domain-containing protein [Granulicella sp. dw_53]|uniref:AbrB/MazE/SpoVT family DNA-binding domain-containing protein n=1 Tax=Granulicella sp. dw_53 TaxID=2719792 RepID=UPI001BD67821|nr:AbrB/MazE/SpoVT family DNA-binding domain-containing protein [Granulicella sp. dw_53]